MKDLSENKAAEIRNHLIGFIFQSFNLLPSLSAEENILLPLRLARRSPDKGWYDAIIAALGIKNRLTHRPSELSGGQQQRVAVARALAEHYIGICQRLSVIRLRFTVLL